MNESGSAISTTPIVGGPENAHTLAGRCPHLATKFDPAMADPYPLLAELRRDAPVFYMPEYGFWCVTRHEDALAIYRDPISFSNVGMHDIRVPLPPAIIEQVGADYEFPFQGQLNTIDPPEHTRVRKLMQKAFTPRRVNEREGRIRELANDLLNEVIDDGATELVSSFTSPLPVNVVGMLLGATQEHANQFRGWVADFFTLSGSISLPEDKATKHWGGLIEFERFARALIADHHKKPADDLTTAMIQAETEDGEPSLSDEEILQQVFGILLAGSDTTSVLIAEVLHELLVEPERWQRVVADPSLAPQAIEEALRLRSPVRGLRRVTTCNVELGGVKLPQGADIYFMHGSANRDDTVFAEPERYDLFRDDVAEHLGLGKWTHFCLGAVLARLEGKIALESLIDRLPGLRLAPGQGQLEYDYNLVVPVLHELRVEWDPRARGVGTALT